MDTLGEIKADLRFAGISITQNLVVAGLGCCDRVDGILGMDFLGSNACSLDLWDGTLRIYKQTLRLVRDNSDVCSKVEAIETVILPPCCEKFIKARVVSEKTIEEAEVIVEN